MENPKENEIELHFFTEKNEDSFFDDQLGVLDQNLNKHEEVPQPHGTLNDAEIDCLKKFENSKSFYDEFDNMGRCEGNTNLETNDVTNNEKDDQDEKECIEKKGPQITIGQECIKSIEEKEEKKEEDEKEEEEDDAIKDKDLSGVKNFHLNNSILDNKNDRNSILSLSEHLSDNQRDDDDDDDDDDVMTINFESTKSKTKKDDELGGDNDLLSKKHSKFVDE